MRKIVASWYNFNVEKKDDVDSEKKIEIPQHEIKSEDAKRVKTVVEEILPVSLASRDFGVKETDNISRVEIKETKRTFLKFFLITFGVTMILLLLAGGVYVYLKGIGGQQERVPETTSTPPPSETPSATPISGSTSTPRPLSSYGISILNGSGKIGAATTAKNLLVKAGFKVASTGNAENFNFETTLIQAKANVNSDVVDKIKESLSASFKPQIGETLDTADKFDIIITVGSQ